MKFINALVVKLLDTKDLIDFELGNYHSATLNVIDNHSKLIEKFLYQITFKTGNNNEKTFFNLTSKCVV